MAKIWSFLRPRAQGRQQNCQRRNYNMEESTSACPGGMQTSYKKPVSRQGRGRAETVGLEIHNRTWPRIATQ